MAQAVSKCLTAALTVQAAVSRSQDVSQRTAVLSPFGAEQLMHNTDLLLDGSSAFLWHQSLGAGANPRSATAVLLVANQGGNHWVGLLH
jgi:hypothetical protein